MVAGPITVVQMLPDLESGGVERGTLELGKYLSANGHHSIVISAGGRMVPQLEKEGSRHISWKVGAKHPVCLQYILPLRRLLQELEVDILHLRSRLPAWIGYLAWKSLPERRRPRLVTTFHGFYSINSYSAVMAKGERVVAISKIVAAHIKTRYGVEDNRLAIIYRGFDESVFSADRVSEDRISALRNQWRINDPVLPVILLPARITRLKGHDLLLKGLSIIKHLPWVAVCAGDMDTASSYSSILETMMSSLGLENRVKFTGFCNDMPAALMLSDIVVSTSIEPEAFGRTLIEAQAMGKPVIASAHGGSLEVVLDHRTGWLVPPGDVERFAKALGELLLHKDLREKLGRAGQQWVRETFPTEKMCKETLLLYNDLLKY